MKSFIAALALSATFVAPAVAEPSKPEVVTQYNGYTDEDLSTMLADRGNYTSSFDWMTAHGKCEAVFLTPQAAGWCWGVIMHNSQNSPIGASAGSSQ